MGVAIEGMDICYMGVIKKRLFMIDKAKLDFMIVAILMHSILKSSWSSGTGTIVIN